MEIERLVGLYPDRHSASIPALWAVQERYGWCTPDGIRQAAAVMRVTPAYLEGIATFYDMLHTEPVGTHKVLVCTNISCWMRSADSLLDAFRAAAEGEDVYVSGFECLGACDIAPMASVDSRYYGPLADEDAATVIEQLRTGNKVLPEKDLANRPLAGDSGEDGATTGRPRTRERASEIAGDDARERAGAEEAAADEDAGASERDRR